MTMDAYKLYWLTKSCSNISKFMAESTIRIPPTIQIGPTYIHFSWLDLPGLTPPSIHVDHWFLHLFSPQPQLGLSEFFVCLALSLKPLLLASPPVELVVLLLLGRFSVPVLETQVKNVLLRRRVCSQSVLLPRRCRIFFCVGWPQRRRTRIRRSLLTLVVHLLYTQVQLKPPRSNHCSKRRE